MHAQGAQYLAGEHKKKPFLSYFIHKTDEIFNREGSKDKKAFFTEDEFLDTIQFRFGIPLVCLDFIDMMTGSDLIKTVQMFVNPQNHVERFDTQNVDFNDLK